jgi:hypothetical protein
VIWNVVCHSPHLFITLHMCSSMKFSQFKNLPSSPVHNSSLPFPNKRKNVPPHINSASFLRPQHSG